MKTQLLFPPSGWSGQHEVFRTPESYGLNREVHKLPLLVLVHHAVALGGLVIGVDAPAVGLRVVVPPDHHVCADQRGAQGGHALGAQPAPFIRAGHRGGPLLPEHGLLVVAALWAVFGVRLVVRG